MEQNNQISSAPESTVSENAAQPIRSKFPSVGDVMAFVGILFAGQVVGGLMAIFFGLGAVNGGPELTPEQQGKLLFFSTLIANVVALVGILIYRSVRGGKGPMARFSFHGFNPALTLWGFLLILAMGVALEPLLNLMPPMDFKLIGSGVWTMASLVLVAPIFEELICRGVVLESLRTRYGVVVAWLVSSALFGIIHIYPVQVVNAFFIGLVLAFLYIRTGSIWIVIILHALNNSLAYIFLLLGVDGSLSDIVDSRTMYGAIYFVAILLCVISGVMVWRTLKKLADEDKNRAQA